MQKREYAVKVVFKQGNLCKDDQGEYYEAVYSHLEVVKLPAALVRRARKKYFPCLFTQEVANELKAVANPHNPKWVSYQFGHNDDGTNFVVLAGPPAYNGGPVFDFKEII